MEHGLWTAGPLLLRPEEAARRLGLTIRALDKWRSRGIGPRYVRLSARAIRYPLDGLEEWIASRAGHPSSGREVESP
jgi:predicted DNA-binding transcriptional regulator AlpA